MLKFIAWFLAIFLFMISFGFVFAENLSSIFLNPNGVKKVLNEINFYDQSKSIIKNNILSTKDLDSQEIIDLSSTLNSTIENYNFQEQADATIDSFFKDLKNNPNDISLSYDLKTFKAELSKNVSGDADSPKKDALKSLPDEWRVDLGHSGPVLPIVSFYYRYNPYIVIIYFFLWLILFLVCVSISKKYLNLFFIALLITTLPILGQYLLFLLLKPSEVINFITAGISRQIIDESLTQGGAGLKSLVDSTMLYIRKELLSLLFWESIIPLIVSILGLMIIKIAKIDSKKIPLND
jgi:hypothetical protein